VEDLIDLKSPNVVYPRPPQMTSIPAMLSLFQNEWDALALQTYTLQQNLHQARQELSTALYENDAAVRVIAQLTKERDEARAALAQIDVGRGAPAAANGDAMQVDNVPLPEHVVEKIESVQARYERLAVPLDWRADWILQLIKDSPETTCPRGVGDSGINISVHAQIDFATILSRRDSACSACRRRHRPRRWQ
jgi:pre-mRNA-processing factor 19